MRGPFDKVFCVPIETFEPRTVVEPHVVELSGVFVDKEQAYDGKEWVRVVPTTIISDAHGNYALFRRRKHSPLLDDHLLTYYTNIYEVHDQLDLRFHTWFRRRMNLVDYAMLWQTQQLFDLGRQNGGFDVDIEIKTTHRVVHSESDPSKVGYLYELLLGEQSQIRLKVQDFDMEWTTDDWIRTNFGRLSPWCQSSISRLHNKTEETEQE